MTEGVTALLRKMQQPWQSLRSLNTSCYYYFTRQ